MNDAFLDLGEGVFARVFVDLGEDEDRWYLWLEVDRNGRVHRVALDVVNLIALVKFAVDAYPSLGPELIEAAGGAQ